MQSYNDLLLKDARGELVTDNELWDYLTDLAEEYDKLDAEYQRVKFAYDRRLKLEKIKG